MAELFIRTGTRRISSWPGDLLHRKAGYIDADFSHPPTFPLQSDGEPYIAPEPFVLPLPGTSTGTGVSSACIFDPANTCFLMSWTLASRLVHSPRRPILPVSSDQDRFPSRADLSLSIKWQGNFIVKCALLMAKGSLIPLIREQLLSSFSLYNRWEQPSAHSSRCR